MKTRISLLAISLFVVAGLSGCYTEFATTGNDYYGQDSQGSQGYYYDSSSSGYAYDSTGAPIINNYNYYGYDYPSYGYYDNWWTPSPYWWHSDLSFNFGWGYNSWYDGGWGWGSPYSYYGYGYGYSPFYSPYYYSPFYPYGNGYAYQTGNPTGRVRSVGDTRNGRENYGGGSTTPYVQPVGTSGGVGSANATGGASANTNQTPTRTRTSTPSSTGNTNSGTVSPPRTRSGNPQPEQPQSQPPQEQPRPRDNGNSRGGDNQGSGNQGRSRGGAMSSYRGAPAPHPQRVRYYYWRPQRINAPAMQANRSSWRPAERGYVQPRAEYAAPRSNEGVRYSAPAPAAARSGGGESRSSGGGRTRH
jgi:hypothetical protein